MAAPVNDTQAVNDRVERSWQTEAWLHEKLKVTLYGDLPPHATGVQGAFARAMGRDT